MMMLAFVVLAASRCSRCRSISFPKGRFPPLSWSTAYPGAGPEDRRVLGHAKIRGKASTPSPARRADLGAATRGSRSSSSSSCTSTGARQPMTCARRSPRCAPACATRSMSLRVQALDPSSRPIWSVAILPDSSQQNPPNAVELTNWAEQVFKKRWRTCAASAVTLAAPAAHGPGRVQPGGRAFASRPSRSSPRSGRRTRTCRSARAALARARARGADRGARGAPAAARRLIVARRNGQPVRLGQSRALVDGAQELDSLALDNGDSARCCCRYRRPRMRTRWPVIDGLKAVRWARSARKSPPALGWSLIGDTGCRSGLGGATRAAR